MVPRGPALSQGGSLSCSGPLSAVCHAGLVVPTPGILELPSLPFPHSFIHLLFLGFVCTDIIYLSHTHTNIHIYTRSSPLLLASPSTGLHPPNLEPGFNMLHAFLFPISPFLVVTGPPLSLYSWGSQQTLLLLIIMGEAKPTGAMAPITKRVHRGSGFPCG